MKDFTGFRFGNFHTKDLNLVVVSSGNRYQKNLLPPPQDYTLPVAGGDGDLYFGQTFQSREFTCDIAFNEITEENWRKISQLFSSDKLQDLVFDELPYKTYKAKLKSKPEFKFICFTDRNTGERVYKGEGSLTFICYFPYAYGFNKYIVRAADYYKKTPPQKIIEENNINFNPYKKQIPIKDKHTREYYNVENNNNTPWKGGYPTIEQVQNGELFFNTPDGEKTIIDVRGYWENVPEWAESSKLLYTPTLDYDQGLIFMPQYSKSTNINMDIAIDQANAMIGSRMLVYNPGDIPIDFNADLFNNERTFWTGRGQHFQIRRFNVQRMPIPMAVDLTGLKTYSREEDKTFKYGKKYFKRKVIRMGADESYYDIVEFGEQHPDFTYIAEPIPREELGKFIRMFFWQSATRNSKIEDKEEYYRQHTGIADRYEELRNLCKTDYEEYELYWKTLKDLFTDAYKDKAIFNRPNVYDVIKLNGETMLDSDIRYLYVADGILHFATAEGLQQELAEIGITDYTKCDKEIFYEKDGKFFSLFVRNNFVFDKPLEQITEDMVSSRFVYLKDIKGQVDETYQISKDSTIHTDDLTAYFLRTSHFAANIDKTLEIFLYDYVHRPPEFIRKNNSLEYGQIEFHDEMYPQWYTNDYLEISTEGIEDTKMYLEMDKRLLYNKNIEENKFEYRTTKEILNDNIVQGKWFKIPKGWSMIEIIPVCDEDNWGGKRWLDARPFDWGYGGDEEGRMKKIQEIFNEVYNATSKEFLKSLGLSEDDVTKLQFRRWYADEIEEARKTKEFKDGRKFAYEYYRTLETNLEYDFLKLLAENWKLKKGTTFYIDDKRKEAGGTYTIKGSISEWWWYACNYIWANFPPLYWGYVDILNRAKIDYVPLFY